MIEDDIVTATGLALATIASLIERPEPIPRAEVGRCLREGRLESDVMSLDETLSIMATMDEIRRQIGLTYPGE